MQLYRIVRHVAIGSAIFLLSSFDSTAAREIVAIEKRKPAPAEPAAPVTMARHPRFKQIAEHIGMQDYQLGLGVTWGDYNGDGWPDLFAAGYSRHPDMLYMNTGEGAFVRTDTAAGIDAGPAAGFGAGWADYDNDGDQDLFVANVSGQQDFLWQNQGDGTFKQVAPDVGMKDIQNHFGVAWGDYDGDGHLDLYLTSGTQDFLYHSLGNGTFEQVAEKSGMTDSGAGSGCAWGDYDADGDLDLYVTNGGNDFLYRNNGNGTFKNVASEAGIVESSAGQGVAWGDYDNDGDLDVFVANYSNQRNFLWQNQGDGTFKEMAEKTGMTDQYLSRGCAWGDLENDGDLDLFISNDKYDLECFYRNNGNGTFARLGREDGLFGGWATGIALCDYDLDGDLDVYVAHQVTHQDYLYQNQDTGEYNWIKINPLTAGPRRSGAAGAQVVECPHCGTKFNPLTRQIVKSEAPAAGPYRLAIGAWVEVDLDGGADFKPGIGRYVAALVGAGDGTASGAIPAHLGVGKARTVDIRVKYPTGQVVKQTGVPVKQTVTIKDR